MNRQDDQFNWLSFQMRPASDPSLPRYLEIHQWGLEEMLWSTYRDPLNQWRMNQTAAESSDKHIKKREEENKQVQRKNTPVAPGIPIIPWRYQEERRRGEQLGFNVTSLRYCSQGMENEKARKEESK